MTLTNFIPTHEIYRELIATTDTEKRHKLYMEKIVTPWKPMMQMMGQLADDELAVARMWKWLLPEHLDHVPESLKILQEAQAWQVGAVALQKGIEQFASKGHELPFDEVEGWLILADPENADPIGRGYTGAIDFMNPRFVVQYDTPNAYNLPRLSGAIVHELHHLIRLRIFPWNMMETSVGDYIIHEGMAESFAQSIFSEDVLGYYVTDISEDDLLIAQQLIQENVQATGFNVIRSYIFGDHISEKYGLPVIGMPNFGGYAIGYHVVQAYLKRTGKTVVDATFVPAETIIQESGYFDVIKVR